MDETWERDAKWNDSQMLHGSICMSNLKWSYLEEEKKMVTRR
jgi:hypothetical protein